MSVTNLHAVANPALRPAGLSDAQLVPGSGRLTQGRMKEGKGNLPCARPQERPDYRDSMC